MSRLCSAGNCIISEIVQDQFAQGLTAVSSGKVQVMLMTHDCIMEVSAGKDEIFVESLLHIVQKRNKDSVVCAYSLEEESAHLFCQGPDSK